MWLRGCPGANSDGESGECCVAGGTIGVARTDNPSWVAPPAYIGALGDPSQSPFAVIVDRADAGRPPVRTSDESSRFLD